MPFALITRLLTGEAGMFFARLRNMVVWYAVVGIFALIMLVFLVIALFTWVASHLGILSTALIFAGIFLVLALIAFAFAKLLGSPSRTRREENLQRDIASIAGITAMANAPQLVRLFRRKRGLLALPVVAVGFFGLYKAIAAFRER